VKKIALLLILSNAVNRIEFKDDEGQLFSFLGRIGYSSNNLRTLDMKSFGKEVLIEQSIIAIVSTWETYFSNISQKILDDDDFIDSCLKNKDKFEKFLNKTKLTTEFQQSVLFNKNNYTKLKFGARLIEKKKINFQDIEIVKLFLKLLLDIDIERLSQDWNSIAKVIEARHILIHRASDNLQGSKEFYPEFGAGKKTLKEIYTQERIFQDLEEMYRIIEKIESDLFNKYDTQYLNKK
jgi:hypothetical protein